MLNKKSFLGILILASSLILVIYQNCAPTGGGIFDPPSCTTPECEGVNAENLKLELPSTYSLALPADGSLGATGTSNFNLTGTCDDGNFSKNIIRWEILTTAGVRKFFGSTNCNRSGDVKVFSIRKFISRETLGQTATANVNYNLKMTIYGITEYNELIAGSQSYSTIRLTGQHTIAPPKLLNINSNGTPAANQGPPPSNWLGKLRVTPVTTSISAADLIRGLCTIHDAATPANNNVKVIVTKINNPTLTDTNHIVFSDIKCEALQTNIDGYNGYFVLGKYPSINSNYEFFLNQGSGPNGINYENCNTSNGSIICGADLGGFQNRFFDFIVSQTQTVNNTPFQVSDRRSLALVFQNNFQFTLSGKTWTLDIMIEVFKRLKNSLNFSVSIGELRDLSQIDASNMAGIFSSDRTPPFTNRDNDGDQSAAVINYRETFSTRGWILSTLGLVEGRFDSVPINTTPVQYPTAILNIPIKIDSSLATELKETLFASSIGNSVINGALCVNTANQMIFGLSGADTSQKSLEIQRLAMCIVGRAYTGLYKHNTSQLEEIAREGVTISNPSAPYPQCSTATSGTNLNPTGSDHICRSIVFVFNETKGFVDAFIPSGGFSQANQEQKNNFMSAYGQWIVNVMMSLITADKLFVPGYTGVSVLEEIIKSKLNEYGLGELASNETIITSLKPMEENFTSAQANATFGLPAIAAPKPFAAYTSANTLGSTCARGSYTLPGVPPLLCPAQ